MVKNSNPHGKFAKYRAGIKIEVYFQDKCKWSPQNFGNHFETGFVYICFVKYSVIHTDVPFNTHHLISSFVYH